MFAETPDWPTDAPTPRPPTDVPAATPERLTEAPALAVLPADAPADTPERPTEAPTPTPPTLAPADIPPRPTDAPAETPPPVRELELLVPEVDEDEEPVAEELLPEDVLLPLPRPPRPPRRPPRPSASTGKVSANVSATAVAAVFLNMVSSFCVVWLLRG
jgi:hypothetical protein